MKKLLLNLSILLLLMTGEVKASVQMDTILVFRETFNALFTGEPNGKASTVDISEKINEYLKTSDWVADKAYSAGGSIKLGTSSIAGSIMTPPIALDSNGGEFSLRFKLMAWNGDATSLKLWVNDSMYWVEDMPNDATYTFKTYELTFSGGKSLTTLRFEGKRPSKSRFFLDEFYVFQNGRQILDTLPPAKDTAWLRPNILALKDQNTSKTYRLESQVRLTAFCDSSKKIFFVQDSSGGILVYDTLNFLKSKQQLYTGIKGLEGRWKMIETFPCFVLTSDSSLVMSAVKEVKPNIKKIENLTAFDDGCLLQFNNLSLDSLCILLPNIHMYFMQDTSPLQMWFVFPNADYYGDTLYAGWSYSFTGIYFKNYFSPRFSRDIVAKDPYLCDPPYSLASGGLTNTSVQLVWSGFSDEYELRLNDTLIVKVNVPQCKLYDLIPNTTYRWEVRSVCSSIVQSQWVSGKSFTTKKVDNEINRDFHALEIGSKGNLELELYAKEYMKINIFDTQGRLLKMLFLQGKKSVYLYQKGIYIIHYQGRLNGVKKVMVW